MADLLVGSNVDLGGHLLKDLAAGTAADHAVNLLQLQEVPWTAETYNADYDAMPLGWTTSTPGQTNDPGISGSGGYLTETFANEDDTARVQVSYSAPNGEMAIRYRLSGVWSSWIVHVPGTTFGKSLLTAADAAAARSALSVSSTAQMNTAIAEGVGLRDGLQWYQTFTLHAVGVGQQDMGILIPYDAYIVKYRFRIATAGTGGSLAAELRLNGTAGGNLIGASQTPATSPSWTTPTAPGLSVAEDDLIWAYITAINTTTVGSQLKAELILERR